MSIDLNLGDTQIIIDECKRYGCSLEQTAYILATAKWETNHTMKPVEEAYWLSDAWRKKNLHYYPWHGRGYVQLTWERNYKKATIETGADLIAHPEAAMEPKVAAKILVKGSMQGWFTGKKLTDYISDVVNFQGSRRVINGTDRAGEIADLAMAYCKALEPTYGNTLISKPSAPKVAPKSDWITQLIQFIAELQKGFKK